ncbi:MAG: VWA domain-containing protein [Sphingomonadaceae bacterium]|nr:VWA domain-containing protein [Sphingomonadaceae bacterium]
MERRMHKGLSALAIVAMLAQGPVAIAAPEAASRAGPQGLCRSPDPLPLLGVEAFEGQQRPRPEPMGKGGRPVRVAAAPTAIPAPPPPAPPAPVSDAFSVALPVPADGAAPAEARPATSEASRTTDGTARIMPPYPPYPPRPQPRPQSGLLTAGEHDDLLNPELYADYVRRSSLGQAVPDLPQLDTDRVLTVTVKDSAGRPVPFAPVVVTCADGGQLTLRTTADGTAVFFPDLDRLGREVRVRAGREEERRVSIARSRGGQRVDFTLGQAARTAQKLDLVLTIDTTGSMGDEIRYLQAELGAIVAAIRADHPGLDLRVGFVFYRDVGDDYVTATVPLSRDIDAAQAELRQRFAGGGGDYPEAMDQALIRAAGLDWRPDAVKTMLLVADAPPHDDKFGLAWRAAEHLRHSRVHIVPVAASGVADKAEYAMRAMAAATQSRYTFLTDDSGIGNPHAPPAIDCYLVTRLDALLRRVIDSQLSGRRIEPNKDEIIRSLGQYDQGRCVIPPDFGQQ